MSDVRDIKPRPDPLPVAREDFLLRRKLKEIPNLNDLVERIVVIVYDDPKFQAFISAVYDEDAVEGSLAADNYKAAEMIRDYAKDHNNEHHIVASKKLATISKALGVVLRRFDADRKTRKHTVLGELVTVLSAEFSGE